MMFGHLIMAFEATARGIGRGMAGDAVGHAGQSRSSQDVGSPQTAMAGLAWILRSKIGAELLVDRPAVAAFVDGGQDRRRHVAELGVARMAEPIDIGAGGGSEIQDRLAMAGAAGIG